MFRFSFTLILALAAGFSVSAQNTSNFCGTGVPTQQWESTMQDYIQTAKLEAQGNRTQPVLRTIPVIIHVIHGGQAIGSFPNLSNAQLTSQITVLNEDYAGMGYNSWNYNSQAFAAWAAAQSIQPSSLDAFGRVQIANCYVQFCLATRDTLGNLLAEPGIERINYSSKGWTNPAGITNYNAFKSLIDNTIKPQTIWNVSKYLNIWVTDENLNSIGLLGYATFPPFSTLAGMPSAGSSTTDGFWCYAASFGSVAHAPFGSYTSTNMYGRTCSHEIGHYLGLRHIWGDGTCATDYCNDTPPASDKNFYSPVYPFKVNSCAGNSPDGEMFMNFMDYTDDNIKYMFTNDQATRIQTALANSPYRKFLGTHNLCSVDPEPVVAKFGSPVGACGPVAVVTLSNQTSGVPVPSYTWFTTGNAVVNPGINSSIAAIAFPSAGVYTITLAANNGTLSTYSKVITIYPASFSVTGYQSVVCQGQQLTLTASGANSYVWYPDSVMADSITIQAIGNSSYSVSGISPNGCTSTQVVQYTTMDCTGLNEHTEELGDFLVQPNPATDQVRISYTNENALTVAVKDITGRVMMQQQHGLAREVKLELTGLPPGLYFLQLSGDKEYGTVKLVKQ